MNFAALQHSVFLRVLGSSILNSLWQVFILWLSYETISVSYKNASARFRNNLSTLLLFFSFAWFVTGFVSKIIDQRGAVSITPATTGVAELPNVHAASALDVFISYAGSSVPYLSVAYIFLLFFLITRLFTAYRYVYIISNRRLLHPPRQLQDFADKVSGQIGITRKISVWISNHIDVPATIGFVKPVILIPLASLNNLSGDQLEAIILHELAHIKRFDYITNIIISVIETILFFNPFVVLLSNVIKRERENCCDDFVLRYRYDPHSYASALLRLEQSRVNNLKLALGAVSGKKQLLSRIKRITNSPAKSRQFNYGQKLLALVFVTGVICSVAWLSPGEKKPVSNNILLKEIKAKKLSKLSFSTKAMNLPGDQKENLHKGILKHISPKKDLTPLKNPGLKVEKKDNFNFNADIPAGGYDDNLPLAKNLKQPQAFLKESKLQLPQSINIKNFPFQNSDFNIDLSKIDMSKLNENLKEAYEEINKINWSKVQNDIRKSFSKMKVAGFPSKEQAELLMEKAKELEFSKIKMDKQKIDARSLSEKINKEIQLRDSLIAKSMVVIYENKAQNQRVYSNVQDQYAESTGNGYSFKISPGKNTEDNTTVWVTGDNLSTLEKKHVKISVRHSSRCDNVHAKKLLQFSFDNEVKTPGREKVINVEVNDLP